MPDADAGAVRFLTSALDGKAYRADVNLPTSELRVASFRIEAGVLETLANDDKLKEILRGAFEGRAKEWEGKMDGLTKEPELRKRVNKLEGELESARRHIAEMLQDLENAKERAARKVAEEERDMVAAQRRERDARTKLEEGERRRKEEEKEEEKERERKRIEEEEKRAREQKKDKDVFHDAEEGLEDETAESAQSQKDLQAASKAAREAASQTLPIGWEKVHDVPEEDWAYWRAIVDLLKPDGSINLANTVGRFYEKTPETLPSYRPVEGSHDGGKAKERGHVWAGIFDKREGRFSIGKRDWGSILVITEEDGTVISRVTIRKALDALRDAFLFFIAKGKNPILRGAIEDVPQPVVGVKQHPGVLERLISADLAMERLARGLDTEDNHFLFPDAWWIVLALQLDSKATKANEAITHPSSDFLAAIGKELDM